MSDAPGARSRPARWWQRAQGRAHAHGGSDLEDVLTTTSVGLRTLAVTSAALAAIAVIEFILVAPTGSVGLLGDAIHNAADVLTAVPLAVAFLLQRRPPTRRYTYGYGRAEDLAGVVVCLVIAASAVATGIVSVERLVHPAAVHHLWAVVAAGSVGFVGNELVALYRIRAGQRLGSAALVADGRHARVDGLTSLAVVAGALGVSLGWDKADAIVGLGICVVILSVLRTAATEVFRRLMDSVDPELVAQIEAVLRGVEGVDDVLGVRLRWIGHRLEAEATIVSDGAITLRAAHDIAAAAHHRLLDEVPRLSYALLHSDPSAADPGEEGRDEACDFP